MQSNTTNRSPNDLLIDEPGAALETPVDLPTASAAGLAGGVAPTTVQSESLFTEDAPTVGVAGPGRVKRRARWALGWAIALMVMAGLAVTAFVVGQRRASDRSPRGQHGEPVPNAISDSKSR